MARLILSLGGQVMAEFNMAKVSLLSKFKKLFGIRTGIRT